MINILYYIVGLFDIIGILNKTKGNEYEKSKVNK